MNFITIAALRHIRKEIVKAYEVDSYESELVLEDMLGKIRTTKFNNTQYSVKFAILPPLTISLRQEESADVIKTHIITLDIREFGDHVYVTYNDEDEPTAQLV